MQSFGGAVAKAGQQVGAAIDSMQGESEKYDAERRFQEFKWDRTLALDEQMRSVEPGQAEGFTEGYISDYTDRAREFIQTVPDDLKPKYDHKLFGTERQIYREAKTFERKEQKRSSIADLEDFKNNTLLQPGAIDHFGEAKSDFAERVENNPHLTPIEKEEQLRTGLRDFEQLHIERRLERGDDPLEIRRELLEGEPAANISLEDAEGGPSESLFSALIWQESRGDPNAVSHKGARGLAQVMPSTGREIAQELDDQEALEMSDAEFKKYLLRPEVSLRYGRHYMSKMMRRYSGDVEAALVAYNGGPKRADRWLRAGRDDSVLPKETRKYYKSVLGRARQTAAGGAPEGLIEPGNIDPTDRPAVADPEGGDPMTVRTISIGTEQGEVLIPTISPQGKPLSEEDAVRLYRRTGKHLGIFQNPEQATEYAESLSKQQGKRLAGGTYNALTAEDRRKLSDKLEVAARNQVQQDVDDAAEQLRREGTVEIDDQGRTVLERAKPILTRHQYEDAKLKWAKARIEYDAMHDLERLPEAEMQERLDQIAPKTGEKYYEMKAEVYDDAVRRAEKLRELRDNDPAAAVADFDEVEQAAELLRANPEDPQARLELSRARMDAQDSIGIPPGLQTPITNLEARVIMAPTRGLDGVALKEAVEKVQEDLQEQYGPYARAAGISAVGYIVKSREVAETITGLLGAAMEGMPVSAAKIRRTEWEAEELKAERALALPGDPMRQYGMEALEAPRGVPATEHPFTQHGMRRQPPQRAIDMLKANPGLRGEFDQHYGPGSAEKVLGEQGE